jgi:DNA polymerase III epsilon subunit-like protein
MKVIVFDTETNGLPRKVIKTPSPTSIPTKTRVTEEDGGSIQYSVASETETLWPHIVQFSYIIYDTTINEILKVSDNIIKLPTGVVIPQECINIHGITNEMSANRGVELDLVLCKFMRDVQLVDKIVAHNMNFDFNVIKAEVHRTMNHTYTHFTRRAVEIIERYKGYLYILANLKEKLYCTMRNTISLCNIQMTTKTGRTFAKFPKLVELHEKLFEVAPKKLHNSLNDVVVCLRCYYQLEFGIDICVINAKIQKQMSELL